MKKTPCKKRQLFTFLLLLLAFALSIPKEATAQWLLFGRVEKRYDRCVELYNEKHYDEARECIKEFIESYPNSRWVEHLQFLDAKMETDAVEAKKKLHRFVMEYPNGEYSAKANFSLGEVCELTGDYEEAQRFYNRVYLYSLENDIRHEAGLRVAKCMLLAGDAQAAKNHLIIYLATWNVAPWHARAKELYADALYQSGEYMQALTQYKEIISEVSSPEELCPHCYLKIAEIYELKKDYEAAFQVYRQFLNTFPNALQKAHVEAKIKELASTLNINLSDNARPHLIEAGVFASEQEAMRLVGRLKRLGYQAYIVTLNTDTKRLLSVRLGPYESRESALAAAEQLNKEAGLEVALLPQGGQF